MHKSRILIYFLLSFLVGVGLGSFVFLSQILIVIFFVIGVLGVMLFWRRNWIFVIIGCSIIFFVFGLWRIEATRLDQGILSQFANKSIKINLQGYVSSEPDISADKQKLVILVKEFYLPGYGGYVNEKVLVTEHLNQHYEYGQIVSFSGALMVPNFTSGDFDYRSYLLKDGIFTTMFYPKIEPIDLKLSWSEQSKVLLLSNIFKLKRLFESAVKDSIPEPNASFVNGILLGSKSQIPEDLKDAFARTSMSHVLAISGYNIVVISEIVSMFLLLFFRRQTAFWFSLLAILLFTILTGAQASVVRASIMGLIALLARREGRFYNVKNSILFTASVMIFISPMILRYDVGFQLSFMATLGLIFISPRLENIFMNLPDKFGLKETFILSLSAQIFVLPLLLYYFKNLSLLSLPTNLLVLPTIPYAMLLGFITGVITMVWPFVGHLVGYLTWLLSSIEILVVRTFSQVPFATLPVSFNWILVLLSYVGLTIYLVYDFFESRRRLANNDR